jgi:hypothetical protein
MPLRRAEGHRLARTLVGLFMPLQSLQRRTGTTFHFRVTYQRTQVRLEGGYKLYERGADSGSGSISAHRSTRSGPPAIAVLTSMRAQPRRTSEEVGSKIEAARILEWSEVGDPAFLNGPIRSDCQQSIRLQLLSWMAASQQTGPATPVRCW